MQKRTRLSAPVFFVSACRGRSLGTRLGGRRVDVWRSGTFQSKLQSRVYTEHALRDQQPTMDWRSTATERSTSGALDDVSQVAPQRSEARKYSHILEFKRPTVGYPQ